MDKIISFIIPSYNVEQYLKVCLDSFVIPEWMEQLEVIVVNDGSGDRTAEIAASYMRQYPGTFRLINKENGGHGSAVNAGSKAASGRFLKVIDADDWVVTENLPELLEKLAHCDADVVLTPFHMVDMVTRKREIRCMYLSDYQKSYSLEEIMTDWKSFDRCMTFHGIAYRRAFYEANRHELPEKIFYEDQEYASIPCCHAARIQAFDLFLYQYLVGNTGQSVAAHNQLKRIDHIGQVALNMADYYAEHHELAAGGKAYLAQKIEGVLLSYYTVSCVVNPNKADGRRKCHQLHAEIQKKSPELVQRMKKKYFVYQVFSFMRLTPEGYQRLLNSRLYNLVRKNHTRESE